MRRPTSLAAALLAVCTAGACYARAGVDPMPADWEETFGAASMAAHEHRYAAADSLLAAYMSVRWGSREAREAAYWRAVYLLDPENPEGSARNALPLLELYLADTTVVRHSQAARALWALATRQDSLRLALLQASSRPDTVVARFPPPRAPSPREEELEREVARLKQQLEETAAELERLKRRLVRPP